jgi:hypothetical protein
MVTLSVPLRLLVMTAVLLGAAGTARAQDASPAHPAPPNRGAVKLEMVPSLIVMNALGASLQGQVLTLTGVAPTAITFADRPVRAAGHILTPYVLEEWTDPSGGFAKDPPNATVSVLSKDGGQARDAVVELRNPHLDADRLTFEVRVLEAIWRVRTGRRPSSSTSSACRSRHCRLPAWPVERQGAPIGMAPRRRRITGRRPMPIRLTRRRPTTRTPTIRRRISALSALSGSAPAYISPAISSAC